MPVARRHIVLVLHDPRIGIFGQLDIESISYSLCTSAVRIPQNSCWDCVITVVNLHDFRMELTRSVPQ